MYLLTASKGLLASDDIEIILNVSLQFFLCICLTDTLPVNPLFLNAFHVWVKVQYLSKEEKKRNDGGFAKP